MALLIYLRVVYMLYGSFEIVKENNNLFFSFLLYNMSVH